MGVGFVNRAIRSYCGPIRFNARLCRSPRCGSSFFCKGLANLFFKGAAIVLFYSEAQQPGPSLGPLVPGSSGPLVLRSCGRLVLWSLGPLVPWSSGPLVLWSLGPLVPWSSCPSSSGPLILWPLGASDREVVLTFPGYI